MTDSKPQIEKGIPIPPLSGPPRNGGRKSILEGMEIGDSMFIPGSTVSNLATRATSYGKPRGMKFTCRTVEGGARIWRVA